MSMKQGKKYSAQRTNKLKEYLPQEMHCSSTLDEPLSSKIMENFLTG